MPTEETSMKHLVIDRIEVRPTQNKVKKGFVKMQLICRDSKAKSGKTKYRDTMEFTPENKPAPKNRRKDRTITSLNRSSKNSPLKPKKYLISSKTFSGNWFMETGIQGKKSPLKRMSDLLNRPRKLPNGTGIIQILTWGGVIS